MKILITGGDGFIGKHLSEYLRKKYKIFIVKRPSFVSGAVADKNNIAVDLTNAERTKVVFKKFKRLHKIDVIMHLSCNVASSQDIDNVDILHKNILIIENVVEIAKMLKPKKLINFSSIAVYPNEDGVYSESCEVKPSVNNDCLYGLAKLCGENLLDFGLRNEDIMITHLRVAQVYGEGMRADRVIPVMLDELRRTNAITVFGDGMRMSNFIKLNKLVRIVDIFVKRRLSGIYNIGGENINYLTLAKRLIKEHGNKQSRIIKDPEGLRPKFRLDTRKLSAVLKKERKWA